MIRIQVLVFCVLFFQNFFLFAQQNVFQNNDSPTFEELEIAITSSSEKVLLIDNSKKLSHLKDIERNYIKAKGYKNLGHFEIADSILEFSIGQYNFQEDSLLYIKYLLVLADLQKIEMDNKESISNLNKAYQVAFRQKDTSYMITSKISQGEFYRATHNFNQGLKSLKSAEMFLDTYKGKDRTRLQVRLYQRRSSIFIETKTYPDSIERMSLKTIALTKQLKDADLEAGANNILGFFYQEQNPSNDKAEFYLKNAIQIWDSIGFEIYATTARTNLASFLLSKERTQEAIDLILPIESIVDSNTWKYHGGFLYSILGEGYTKLGNYPKAIYFIKKGHDLVTEKLTINYNKDIIQYAIELEVKEKEEEIRRKQTKIELNELELIASKAEKNTLILFLVVAALLVGLSLYFWYLQRSKKKLLFEKNLEITKQKDTISERNVTLSELLLQREDLLKEVNHRVKNNLTILSSLLYLQSENLEGDEAKNALKISQGRVQSIALIHESLYEQLEIGAMDYQAYIENLYERIKNLYWLNKKPIVVDIQLAGYIPKLEESVPLGMILNELITNSFKYAFDQMESPFIHIQFIDNCIVYFDNGPGFSPDKSTNSLGLKLIYTFAIRLKASIKYKLVDGFTHTIIQLP